MGLISIIAGSGNAGASLNDTNVEDMRKDKAKQSATETSASNTGKPSVQKANNDVADKPIDTNNETGNGGNDKNTNGQKENDREQARWITSIVIDTIMALGTIFALFFSYNANKTSEASLDLTRKSIESSDSTFRIQNLPFLEAKDFEFTYLQEVQNLQLKFKVHNLGQYPARILDLKTLIFFNSRVVDSPFTRLSNAYQNEYTQFRVYVTQDNPAEVSYYKEGFVVPKRMMIDSIGKGKWDAYLVAEIFYVNEVTQKLRRYRFYCRFKQPALSQRDTYVDENIDIDYLPKGIDLKSFGIDTFTRFYYPIQR